MVTTVLIIYTVMAIIIGICAFKNINREFINNNNWLAIRYSLMAGVILPLFLPLLLIVALLLIILLLLPIIIPCATLIYLFN